MLSLLLSLSFFAQLISASVNIVNVNSLKVYDAYSCELPNTPTQKGFDVDFYTYSSGDNKDFISSTYVAYEYTQSKHFGSTTGLTDPSDNLSEFLKTDYIAVEGVYAQKDLTITNFTAQFTGYFYADTTGYYDFALNNIDDAVMLFMGTEAAFECCSGTIDKSKAEASNAYQVYAYLQWHIDGTPSSSYTQFLEAGKYYPIRIVYINVEGSLAFNLAVTLPNGNKVTDFGNHIYSAKEYSGKGTCKGDLISSSIEHHTTTEYIHWTSSVSSATTETNTASWGTNTVIDYIPDYTTTSTDVWTGLSTSKTTKYPSNNNQDDTVTVEVFTPRATDTSTISWSGTYTSTFTTIVPTNAHTHATVEVEIPSTTSKTTMAAAYTSSLGEPVVKLISINSTTSSSSISSTTSSSSISSTTSSSSISSTTSSSISSTTSSSSISSTTSSSIVISTKNSTSASSTVFENKQIVSTTSDASSSVSTTSSATSTPSASSSSEEHSNGTVQTAILFNNSTSAGINSTVSATQTTFDSSTATADTNIISTNDVSVTAEEDYVVSFTGSAAMTTSSEVSSSTSKSGMSTLATQIKDDIIASASNTFESQNSSPLPSQTSAATVSTSFGNNDISPIQFSNSGIKFQIEIPFLAIIFISIFLHI